MVLLCKLGEQPLGSDWKAASIERYMGLLSIYRIESDSPSAGAWVWMAGVEGWLGKVLVDCSRLEWIGYRSILVSPGAVSKRRAQF